MTILITTQVSEMPKELPPSDFEFFIDYKKGEGPAKRVFGATHRFIEACEACNELLVRSIGARVEPVIILEDIVGESLRTKLKIIWERGGGEAFKSGDWGRVINTFLVEGIKVFSEKTNDEGRQVSAKDIQDTLLELSAGVEGTEGIEVRASPIPLAKIVEVVGKYESVKDPLVSGDYAELVDTDGRAIHINQSIRADISKLKEEAVAKTLVNVVPAMILIVRKPDYLGSTQWRFVYRGSTFSATIEDREWLDKFQSRDIDVRPGDGLRCRVRISVNYGFESEVVYQKHYIERVHEVAQHGIRPRRQSVIVEFQDTEPDLGVDPDLNNGAPHGDGRVD